MMHCIMKRLREEIYTLYFDNGNAMYIRFYQDATWNYYVDMKRQNAIYQCGVSRNLYYNGTIYIIKVRARWMIKMKLN